MVPDRIGPFEVEVDADRMHVCFRRRNWLHFIVCAVMFIPFSAVGAMALTEFLQKPHGFLVLVGLPFATMALLVGITAVQLSVGQERLQIDRDGCRYQFNAILRWKQQHVSLAELKKAVADLSRPDQEPELEIRTLGRSIRFGRGADPQPLKELARAVNRFLHVQSAGATMRAADDPAAPPGDSTIRLERTRDALHIFRRGRWNFRRILEFTVITLFIGGIVGTAAGVLIMQRRPLELLFLAPFMVMALLPAAAWLRAVLAPAFSVEWQFCRDALRCRRCFLGAGFWRTIVLPPLESVHVRRFSSRWRTLLERVRFDGGAALFAPLDGGTHALALRDARRQQVATIGRLTEGEARWLREIVRADHADWLVASCR